MAKNKKEPTFGQRNAALLKAGTIALLVLLLLIPKFMIQDLIHEREYRHEDAIREMSSKWGAEQTLEGPIITVPYKVYFRDTSGKLIENIQYAHFLPEVLNINGDLFPELRYRGIYEAVVYKSDLKVSGKFPKLDFEALNIPEKNVMYSDAFLAFGISDLKGIEEQIDLAWNNKKYSFNPGIETNDVLSIGISTLINLKGDKYNFSFDLNLNGSELIYFAPVGKVTNVHLASNWSNPSFDGSFLPDERKVNKDGFEADWKILHLNREYPQSWKGYRYKLNQSSFGVNLLQPVDTYRKSTRAIKYAIMFIALTFLVYFFIEVLNKIMVHPIQYILVGLALCLFYLLLISLSEHIGFNRAYLIASIANIALISFYSKAFLKNNPLTGLLSGILIILYAFIYVLMQLQDYSLLIGSIGLFLVLAVVMYFSRKIDWYGIGIERSKMK